MHVNGSRFSPSGGGYKGIMYLEELGGSSLINHPVEEEDDFYQIWLILQNIFFYLFLFIEILDKVLSVYCTPSLSAKPNVIQDNFNIKYNLIKTKLTFKI